MTKLIESGICPITLATATLTEGVNLPFDIIFLTSLERTRFNDVDNTQEAIVMSTSEFKNLAGRAGRPGFGTGMEGMTIISIPLSPPSTAKAKFSTQRRQIEKLSNNYETILKKLRIESEETQVQSPLALLLLTLEKQASDLLGIRGRERFLHWLETVIPLSLAENAGLGHPSPNSKLADTIDELDGVLISAIHELSHFSEQNQTASSVEAILSDIWQRTFSAVASQQTVRLEEMFVHRGRGLIETIYPDQNDRKRLYQYGFTPCVGRRFEAIAIGLLDELQSSENYGVMDKFQQCQKFINLGRFLTDHTGFKFKVRNTIAGAEMLSNWESVLAWWMQLENALPPAPEKLRSWQRFVSENLEFRLGVALGAVVTQAWSTGANEPQAVPSLDTWRETTGLPWLGFWVRELLRWGTLDPFVAFALAQGISTTRHEAGGMRPTFNGWLRSKITALTADDFIDPRNFLLWERERGSHQESLPGERKIQAFPTGTTGQNSPYKVFPVIGTGEIFWLDPADYELAYSVYPDNLPFKTSHKNDYELRILDGVVNVHEVFTS